MEEEMHRLVIIGCIPRGGRLGHDTCGGLYVVMPGLWTSAWRSVRGEGRDRTLATIRAVLNAANERIMDYSHSRYVSDSESHEAKDFWRKVQLLGGAMRQCLQGIQNLKVTYVTDASVQAGLDLLIQKGENIRARADEMLPYKQPAE